MRIILWYFFLACQVLTAKAILGVGLIYYYYRILFIFLPISPKLGPMMIRLRCMVIKFSINFCSVYFRESDIIVDNG
jgi:hypothetical protein